MKKVREAKQGQILEQKEFADSPSEKIAELAVKDPENVQFKKFTALWNCYMRQVRNLFLICPRTGRTDRGLDTSLDEILKEGLDVKKK